MINKPAGTLTLAGTIRTANNWTYTGGTLDPGSSTLVFAGGTVSGSHTLNAVDFRATTTVAAGTTLTVSGSTTLTAGALNGTGTLAAQGAISQASTFAGGTATLLIDGAGAQTFTGAATTAAGALPLVVINKPAGTLTLAGTIRTANNWTYTGGTLDPGSSTLVFAGGTVSGSHTLNAVDFRATTTVAAGHHAHGQRIHHPHRGRAQRDGHPGRSGSHQPGLDLHRRHRHPADQWCRRPDVHRRRDDRRRRRCPSS